MTTYFWKTVNGKIFVYTDDVKHGEKIPVKPWATYTTLKGLRLTGIQWLVENGTNDWRLVFDGLELSNRDERKDLSVKTNRRGEVIE